MKFLSFLSLGLMGVSQLWGADLSQSTFSQVVKDVKVVSRANETTSTAKVNDLFKSPDLIRTGADSLAELIADDKTITRVGANTVFSFEKAGRAINLEQGSVLFHSPKGKGGGTIRSKGASAAVLGTTIVVTATEGGGFKAILLEGKGQITLPNGDFRVLTAGQVTFVLPGSRTFGPTLNINLGKLVESSRLVQGFEKELPSKPIIQVEIERQNTLITTGQAQDTKLLVGNKATKDEVTVVDQSLVNIAVSQKSREQLITEAKQRDVVIDQPQPPADNVFPAPAFAFDIRALGNVPRSGLVANNITITTPAINLSPYLAETDFTFGAQDSINILGTALEIFGTNSPGTSPNLRKVILAARNGITIAPGTSISARGVGDLQLLTDAGMDYHGVTFYNPDGTVTLQAAGQVVLNGGGVPTMGESPLTQGFSVQGSGVTVLDALFCVSGAGYLTATNGAVVLSGSRVFADTIDLAAQTSLIVSGATVSANTKISGIARQDLNATGGSFSVNQSSGTVELGAYGAGSVDGTSFTGHRITLAIGTTLSLKNATVSGTDNFAASSGQDMTLQGGSYASKTDGSVSFTSGGSIAASGTTVNSALPIFNATDDLTLAPVTANGFKALAASAGRDVSVTGGSYTAATSPTPTAAAFDAGRDLSAANTSVSADGITFSATQGAVSLNNVTANAATSFSAVSGTDLTLNGGATTVSGTPGTAQITAGRDLTATSTTVTAGTVGLTATAGSATLNALTATAASAVNVSAQTDATLTSSTVSASGTDGTATLTAGGSATLTDTSLSAKTVTLAATTGSLTCNNPTVSKFTTLNVNASQNLTVANGTLAGLAIAQNNSANFSAGDTLSVSGTTLSGVGNISWSARTLNLQNINFPGGSTVNLYSQLGQLAPNANTGAASVPGFVNFILNVNYNGNPAQLYVGSTVNIATRR
ncbi:MAG: hypothetical protein EBS05_06520 [Proteobacteria bacterium]|nr:hypothetical protein [Pseudomonadota bacterium]